MAQITARNDTSMLKISSFLGLHENPDGDTTLKNGEMAEMRNFRITQDKHLQIRAGTRTVLNLAEILAAEAQEGAAGDGGETTQPEAETRINGVWRGAVAGKEHTLAAYGGHIWDIDLSAATAKDKGTLTADETTFFGFANKVYVLNGHEYLRWDGGDDTSFEEVEGYVPIVQTATNHGGGGTLLENVNRLTDKRRVQFSPEGGNSGFRLPERGNNISIVKVEVNGEATTGYTFNASSGTLTVNPAPAAGVNTLEVTYSNGESARDEVLKMRYAELFNGNTDTRVFLYGDGSNKTIYSGVEFDAGKASAEYFPDLYEIEVGEGNTPITALVRHYSRMMAFKPSSAWEVQSSTLVLANGATTAAFYVQPVNRQFGNEAAGQVKLLENNPLTLDVGSVYQWKSSTSGYVTNNENNARRISDRVSKSIKEFPAEYVKTFNVKHDHEYWFLYGGKALILNYANDTWYRYENLPFDALLEVEGEKYGFSHDGRVLHFSRDYRSDDGTEIDCYAATGAMDFDRDWLIKNSPAIFVAMQPESNARLRVTVETDRRSDYAEKTVAYSLATFAHMDFGHFSFNTNRKPQVKRVKMKVKKATFYRLVFKSCSTVATATVLETDIQLRYAGNVK